MSMCVNCQKDRTTLQFIIEKFVAMKIGEPIACQHKVDSDNEDSNITMNNKRTCMLLTRQE